MMTDIYIILKEDKIMAEPVYQDGDFYVSIGDTGVPGYRWEAKIELKKENNTYPTFQYYLYGIFKDEILEEAKAWIEDYKDL